MATYDWYRIANKTEFEDSGLVSKEVELLLEGIGAKTFLIVRGNYTSIVVDDLMLPVNMFEDNPYVIGTKAVGVDDLGDIYYGIETDED